MKFTGPLLAALTLASSVKACIRIHSNTGYGIGGDGMGVQIWDNDDFYEYKSLQKTGANRDTHWSFQFGNGHYVELWDEGRAGFVSLSNGYRANLNLKATQCERPCILLGENNCRYRGANFEASLDDGFGNCGNYGHQLCGYGQCNGWHQRGWSEGISWKCDNV